jgi:hypothetical protein
MSWTAKALGMKRTAIAIVTTVVVKKSQRLRRLRGGPTTRVMSMPP